MRLIAFLVAIVAALLPYRQWRRLPSSLPVESAAFLSGILTLLAGAAIGIPGFLEHAAETVSLGNAALLSGGFWSRGMAQSFGGISLYTFLLLTPKGWLTSYLALSGGIRAGGAWFGDPMGDPTLTALDEITWRTTRRLGARHARESREALEGPEAPDRVATSKAAGVPGCDLVIVSSRQKEGWARGVVVYTATTCYRIGEPVERTIAGRLRTLYPLTEHTDLEAVRKSVQYDMPDARPRD